MKITPKPTEQCNRSIAGPRAAHDREFFYAGLGGDSWANCPPVVLDQVARFVMSISAATIIDGYNLLHTIGIVCVSFGPGGLERSRMALLNFLAASFIDANWRRQSSFLMPSPRHGVCPPWRTTAESRFTTQVVMRTRMN